MSFGRDRIISVANMYFNSVVYVTEDSYLATYNVMRLGDIAFEAIEASVLPMAVSLKTQLAMA